MRPTVLCIDDDLDNLLGYEAFLRNHGYGVVISSSSDHGLELFRSVVVDAVILDFHMPWMDGGQVAARMKQLKPQVPIMMLTADRWLPITVTKLVDGLFYKGESPLKLLAALKDMLKRPVPAEWPLPQAA